MNEIEWTATGAVSRVACRNGRKFLVVTKMTPHGTWETLAFEANRFFIPLKRPVLTENSHSMEQAREKHAGAVKKAEESGVTTQTQTVEATARAGVETAAFSPSKPIAPSSNGRVWRSVEKFSLLGALASLAAVFFWGDLLFIPMVVLLAIYTIVNRIE